MTSELISIPMSCEPGARAQHIDVSRMKRSRFQIDEIVKIANHPDFHHFVPFIDGVAMILDTSYADPVTIRWFDKSGQGWSGRIGLRAMLMDWKRVGWGNHIRPDQPLKK